MTRTTPPRPLDITGVFPELTGLARTGFRLHPVPGEPTVHDSSVGGPLLWPADESWPDYEMAPIPHWEANALRDIHLRRALLARSSAPPHGPGEALTEEEQETLHRINAGLDHETLQPGLQPMIPLVQLYARDVPGLPFPEDTDLLQVLWATTYMARPDSSPVQLRWRRCAEVRDVLLAPPEPAYVAVVDFVPVPCVLHPEAMREFPPYQCLDEDLAARLLAWDEQRSGDRYWDDLSVAPGWKAGGWPTHFTFRDPPGPDGDELRCPDCAGPVDALLTVDSSEWDGGASWIPLEYTEGAERPPDQPYGRLFDPTQVNIGRGYSLQIYYCVGTPSHSPALVMQ